MNDRHGRAARGVLDVARHSARDQCAPVPVRHSTSARPRHHTTLFNYDRYLTGKKLCFKAKSKAVPKVCPLRGISSPCRLSCSAYRCLALKLRNSIAVSLIRLQYPPAEVQFAFRLWLKVEISRHLIWVTFVQQTRKLHPAIIKMCINYLHY